MEFEQALALVKQADMGMRLPGWQPDVVVKCQKPDANSKMTHPYLYVESRFGKVPWINTVPEMFNPNWEVVPN